MTGLLISLILTAGPDIWADCEVVQPSVWGVVVVVPSGFEWNAHVVELPKSECSDGNCPAQAKPATKQQPKRRRFLPWRR